MITFIIIAICIALYTLFAKDWLIDCIKDDAYFYESNFSSRILFALSNIGTWILYNILLNAINVLVVLAVSCIVVVCAPTTETHYSFKINALKDNLVTSGEFRGGLFCTTGSIDGEINYYFSRTMNNGEKIGHIPADKTYIKYDNDVDPCIEVHQINSSCSDALRKWFFIDCISKPRTDYYVIIVPSGTISNTNTYQIDME